MVKPILPSPRAMPRAEASAERGDWLVEELVPGGDGMAHLSDGRVAFVTGGLPGDLIHALGVEAKKGHVRATRWELTRPSPHRVAPACPFVEECGGCDWMALERGQQLVHKARLLHMALVRGKVSRVPEDVPVASVGPDLGYRSRVRLGVDTEGRIGFFVRGTREVVEISACAVAVPELTPVLADLRRLPPSVLQEFGAIDVRCTEESPQVAVLFTPRVPRAASGIARKALARLPSAWVVQIDGDDGGEAWQRLALPGGVRLAVGAASFTQINWAVNVALVQAVVDGARARGVERFCDAYAGAGNFTLPLLAAGLAGTSIERDPHAVLAARFAAREHGLDPAGFIQGDAVRVLPELARTDSEFDLVLLDPPRAGAREVLPAVALLAPRVIALCSCDPVTLARDIATLEKSGYRLDELRGFDMFPQTHHVEALAWMSVAPAPRGS